MESGIVLVTKLTQIKIILFKNTEIDYCTTLNWQSSSTSHRRVLGNYYPWLSVCLLFMLLLRSYDLGNLTKCYNNYFQIFNDKNLTKYVSIMCVITTFVYFNQTFNNFTKVFYDNLRLFIFKSLLEYGWENYWDSLILKECFPEALAP